MGKREICVLLPPLGEKIRAACDQKRKRRRKKEK